MTATEYFDERRACPSWRRKATSCPCPPSSADGIVPTGTTKYEKRGIAVNVPEWDVAENCIQCNQCSLVCPHACIRPYPGQGRALQAARRLCTPSPPPARSLPATSTACRSAPWTAPAAATASNVCPAKDKALAMEPLDTQRRTRRPTGSSAMKLPEADVDRQRDYREEQPVPAAPVRVLRRLRGLRRDPLCEAGYPAVRRPDDDRQRHGLLLHLRRFRAHLPLYRQREGPWSRLGQQPV